MKFTLAQYALQGREAALAALNNNPAEANLRRQWAIHALATEHEPDRILARDAYDRAHQRVMVQHREFEAARAARRTA